LLSKYFEQTADIDLGGNDASGNYYNSGNGWVPIGTSSNGFSGYYDGKGFEITGLFINRSGTDDVGLFGYGTQDTLVNMVLIDVDVTGQDKTGALIGRNTNTVKIPNSYATGKVTGATSVGGLVGQIDTGALIDSSFSSTSVTGTTNTGGVIGFSTNGVTATHNYSVGAVLGSSNVGGFVGSATGSNTYTNSYWNTETSGQASSALGTGLSTAQMKAQSNFSGWDFTNTWGIIEGFSFPYLQDVGSYRIGGPEISGDEGWRFLASAFDSTTYDTLLTGLWTQGFTGATGGTNPTSNVQVWSESTQSFQSISAATNIPEAGNGFVIYVYDDDDFNGSGDGFPKSLVAEGKDRSGTISPAVTYTDTGNSADDGWNLLGNPFTAVIDWDASSGWASSNIDGTFYVWSDSADSGAGGYLDWNGSTGTLPNGLIAPGQAFWVKASAASPSLSLTDDVRSSSIGVFYKTKVIPELRFMLSSNGITNQAIVMFSDQASEQNDRLDAYELASLNESWLSLSTF